MLQAVPTEKHPKGHLPEDVFSRLVESTGTYIAAADRMGVQLSVAYHNGYSYNQTPATLEPVELGHKDEVYAASQAKLAIASYVIENPNDLSQELPLVDAMLRDSDNDAVHALVNDATALEVVRDAREKAGITTDILTLRPDGSYFMGHTTAIDSMRLFVHLLRSSRQQGLRDEISQPLAHNTTKYGVRSVLPTRPSRVHLLNKTGDFYGTDDEEVGEAVHNDVGVIFSRHHKDQPPRRLLYSITTSAPSKVRSRLTNGLVKQLGAEYITAVGGVPKRMLGTKAVTQVIKTPFVT